MITLSEVAARAGTSVATASRVLNRKEGVRITQETADRVNLAAQELGYVPNPVARAMAAGRTRTLGIWMVPHPETTVTSTRFLAAITREMAGKLGGQVILDTSPLVPELQLNPVPADWYLSLSCTNFALNYVADHPEFRSRVLIVDDTVVPNVNCLSFDVARAVRRSVEHLIAGGCRDLRYVITEEDFHRAETPRMIAYRDALVALGQQPKYIFTRDDSDLAAYQAVRHALQNGEKFDGILCRRDDMAIGALVAINEAGLRIPGDIAVMGWLAEKVTPSMPLSTVAFPAEALAERAVLALDAMATQPHSIRHHGAIPYEHMQGESTRKIG
ncbi:MAG: LacI family DNA-binding transcriptional regulator [Chthonomonas sp.]|nr:LacI family DNA-binding transcriptional regulator [Chthonomonas sp.]